MNKRESFFAFKISVTFYLNPNFVSPSEDIRGEVPGDGARLCGCQSGDDAVVRFWFLLFHGDQKHLFLNSSLEMIFPRFLDFFFLGDVQIDVLNFNPCFAN